jgi:hypothetical protein
VGELLPGLRGTFESAADSYDAARPSYPKQLFDDLVELAELQPPRHLKFPPMIAGFVPRGHDAAFASDPSSARAIIATNRAAADAAPRINTFVLCIVS